MTVSFPAGLGSSPEAALQVLKLDAVRVVALPHKGSYTSIGESFQKLSAWCAERGLFNESTRMYGIYYDDPYAKPCAELNSDACFSVPENFQLSAEDAPIHITHTSSGRCAQAVFTGPYAELHTAYSWLYQVGLPQAGLLPSELPPIEEYLNDPSSNPPSAWQTAISIPLKN